MVKLYLLVIKDIPDCVYVKDIDKLYFKNLNAITSIFNGINELYREATERYNNFSTEQKNRIPNYISQYCPHLYDATTNRFRISNEKELTELLNTLNQRYYTTEIDGEKRLANSVTKL